MRDLIEHVFLIDKLPTSYLIGGLRLKIETGYKNIILFEMLMNDKVLSEVQKKQQAFKMFFGDQYVSNEHEAVNAILDFYTQGNFKKEENKIKKAQHRKEKAIYSLEHDGALFYSSFLEQYGIDIIDNNLHWWKFKALFEGLSKDTKLAKVMGYRSMQIPEDASLEERRMIKRLKEFYKLPDMRTEREKEEDFANALF